MSQPHHIVRDLQRLLERDADLAAAIEKSLRQAHDRARAELDPDLLQALDWPTDLDGYYGYLDGFVRWLPRQTDSPAWTKSDLSQRYAKEVSDRLSHFFWLIDQKVGDGADDGRAVAQDSAEFRDWLTEFARQWGDFLDTPDSFDEEILREFCENAPEYGVEESLVDGRPNQASGWLTFNQFFARALNPGLRPIADPADNRVITSPADCFYRSTYQVDADSNIPATAVKNTHVYGNIAELMAGSQYADAFADGTFVHYMLPPSSYHRYHLPVAGQVKESFVTTGQVYLQVELEDHQFTAKDNTETGYEFFQTRGVLTVDTAASGYGDVGVVAVIPVGMSHVASVNLATVPGTQVPKGEEFGYFAFGGSDIIVLFQAGVDPQIDDSPGFRKVGTPIARCRPDR